MLCKYKKIWGFIVFFVLWNYYVLGSLKCIFYYLVFYIVFVEVRVLLGMNVNFDFIVLEKLM